MGLFDGIKGEVQQQFIARPDSSKDLVLYKWPETNIRLLSVLTVQPDEWAYFIKQGTVVGYLQGGQHKLDGAQIPFLGGLIDSVTGGNVLMAELYFVSSREFANNKFGGSMGEVETPQREKSFAAASTASSSSRSSIRPSSSSTSLARSQSRATTSSSTRSRTSSRRSSERPSTASSSPSSGRSST